MSSHDNRAPNSNSEERAIEFSVIIPTKDRPEQLAQCLGALALQTYPASLFEVVVVDDGSDPPLVLPPRPEDDALRVRIVRQSNAGPAAARNAGAEHATYARLAFTDDDCRPRPHWLATLARRLGSERYVLLGGSIVNELVSNRFSTASQELVTYVYGYFNVPSPTFFCSNNLATTKDAFISIGGFDTSFPFAAGEDRELCDRWRFAGRPLEYVDDAEVGHAHTLDLRGYCRQHFRYGRAAACYHRLFAKRRGDSVRIEPLRFYLRLIFRPFGRMSALRALSCSGLLLVSQAANAMGFFYESWLARTRSSRRRPSDG